MPLFCQHWTGVRYQKVPGRGAIQLLIRGTAEGGALAQPVGLRGPDRCRSHGTQGGHTRECPASGSRIAGRSVANDPGSGAERASPVEGVRPHRGADDDCCGRRSAPRARGGSHSPRLEADEYHGRAGRTRLGARLRLGRPEDNHGRRSGSPVGLPDRGTGPGIRRQPDVRSTSLDSQGGETR